jgi:16S rRNA (guanine1207-N2)-methyltransferase
MRPGAPIWIYGGNDEGIRSISKRVALVFDDVQTLDARGHCRILEARRRPEGPDRPTLGDWQESITLELDGESRNWTTFPGVFGREKLDAGTRLLIESLPTPPPNSRVLDFACGAGPIGGALRGREDSIDLHLLEADALALEACRHNVEGIYHLGDGWQAMATEPFDWIVSNPPFHVGKDEDHRILESLIIGAPQRLKPGGSMYLVVQSRIPLGRVLSDQYDVVERAGSDRGYQVWRVQ